MQPVIKRSGSKRSQAEHIVSLMPDVIETYYEPFCGGASVFARLAQSNKIVKRFVLSDLNADLIGLWNFIKNYPDDVHQHYAKLWNEMKAVTDWEAKKQYYYSVRERFNSSRFPLDFMFLMRTAFNGMPRYNRNGAFNTSLHFNRDGIRPEKFLKLLTDWSKILNERNVEFYAQSFECINSDGNDFLYLDPPYSVTKGIYYGTLEDYNLFWDFLRNKKSKWILSFDGKTTNSDNTFNVPIDIYKTHAYSYSGNSPFRRLKGKSNKEYVYESLYKNY